MRPAPAPSSRIEPPIGTTEAIRSGSLPGFKCFQNSTEQPSKVRGPGPAPVFLILVGIVSCPIRAASLPPSSDRSSVDLIPPHPARQYALAKAQARARGPLPKRGEANHVIEDQNVTVRPAR